jgi:hypothetical protein
LATGNATEDAPHDDQRDPLAVARGRLGGLKGGKARALKLSPAERKKVARKGAKARWAKD